MLAENDPSNQHAAALFQQQLLTQMLQVGSLFNQRANQAEEEEERRRRRDARDKKRQERRKARQMRRKLLSKVQAEEDLSSSDDSIDEEDPETKRMITYEENLKRRIFLADRFERIEKALVHLGLVSKEVIFCSDFEFDRFKEVLEG